MHVVEPKPSRAVKDLLAEYTAKTPKQVSTERHALHSSIACPHLPLCHDV